MLQSIKKLMEEDPASYDLSTDIEKNVTYEDKNMSNRRNN